jgi:hypothetical protein
MDSGVGITWPRDKAGSNVRHITKNRFVSTTINFYLQELSSAQPISSAYSHISATSAFIYIDSMHNETRFLIQIS